MIQIILQYVTCDYSIRLHFFRTRDHHLHSTDRDPLESDATFLSDRRVASDAFQYGTQHLEELHHDRL